LQTKFKQFIFAPLSRFGISYKLQVTALWGMLESFSSPLFSLILIPIFTHNLGIENYGFYVIFMSFVSFFSFTGLGMNTSITYFLAVNHETSNPKNVAERLGSALVLTLLGTASFACLFLLLFKVFTPSFQTYYPQLIAQQHLIYAALILIVILQLDMVVSASLKGLQQFKISSQVEFVLRLLSFIVVVVVIITQKNVFTIVLITLIMALFSLIVRYITLNKMVHFQFSDIIIKKHSVSELFHFGKWMTLQNISGAIFNSLDKLLLGLYFNTSLVGVYNIIITITQLTHFVLASGSSFLLPKISASNANIKTLKQYYYKSLLISAILSTCVTVILALLYPYFVSYLKLNNIKLEYFLMLISFGVLAMCVVPYYFVLGYGKVEFLSKINAMSAFVGILILVLLVHDYGVFGAIVSRVVFTVSFAFIFFLPPRIFRDSTLAKIKFKKI
jgi:O-antigen/teichoic acid export membrane protein